MLQHAFVIAKKCKPYAWLQLGTQNKALQIHLANKRKYNHFLNITLFFLLIKNVSVSKHQAWLQGNYLASAIPGMDRVRLVKLMKGWAALLSPWKCWLKSVGKIKPKVASATVTAIFTVLITRLVTLWFHLLTHHSA